MNTELSQQTEALLKVLNHMDYTLSVISTTLMIATALLFAIFLVVSLRGRRP